MEMHKSMSEDSTTNNSQKKTFTKLEPGNDSKLRKKKYKTYTIYDTLTLKEKYEIEKSSRLYGIRPLKYFHLLANTNIFKNKIRKFKLKNGKPKTGIIKLKMFPTFLKQIEREAQVNGFKSSSDFFHEEKILEMKKKYKILKKMKSEYLCNPVYRECIRNKLDKSPDLNSLDDLETLNINAAIQEAHVRNIQEFERVSLQRRQMVPDPLIFKGVEIIDLPSNSEFPSPLVGSFQPYMLGNLRNASKEDLEKIGRPKYPFQIPFFAPNNVTKKDIPISSRSNEYTDASIYAEQQIQSMRQPVHRPFKSPLNSNVDFRPKSTPYSRQNKNSINDGAIDGSKGIIDQLNVNNPPNSPGYNIPPYPAGYNISTHLQEHNIPLNPQGYNHPQPPGYNIPPGQTNYNSINPNNHQNIYTQSMRQPKISSFSTQNLTRPLISHTPQPQRIDMNISTNNIPPFDPQNQNNLTSRFKEFYNQLKYEIRPTHPPENYEGVTKNLLETFNIEDFKHTITNIHYHRTINKLFNRNYIRPSSAADLCNNFHEWRRNLRTLLKSVDEVLFCQEVRVTEQINDWIQLLEQAMDEWFPFNRNQTVVKSSPKNKFATFTTEKAVLKNPEYSIFKNEPLKISYIINMIQQLRPLMFHNYSNIEILEGINWLYKMLFKFYEVYQTMNLYYKESFGVDLDGEYKRDV